MADFIRPGRSSANWAVVPKLETATVSARHVEGDPLVEPVGLGLVHQGRSPELLADLGEVGVTGQDEHGLEIPTGGRRADAAVVVGQDLGRGSGVGERDR